LHAVLMSFVVVATGNHWWLDAIVSVVVLSCCAWAVAGGRAAWHRLLGRGDEREVQRAGERPRSFAA
jgi:divalent metal cation (Fe/Co/Zn/Cd) transporter